MSKKSDKMITDNQSCKWYYSTFEDGVLPSQIPEYGWLSISIPGELPIVGTMGQLIRRMKFVDRGEYDGENSYRTGKWLVFRSIEDIDRLWPLLKDALNSRQLGISVKSSTTDETVTCIYTHDWRDLDDIRRVLETLRKLGIKDKLYYKADEQTILGISGSVYCSPSGGVIELTTKGREWYKLTCEELPNL